VDGVSSIIGRSLRPYLVVSVLSAGVSNVRKAKERYCSWFKPRNARMKCLLFPLLFLHIDYLSIHLVVYITGCTSCSGSDSLHKYIVQ